eukprot:scaffold18521_cov37-Tisochrysis_lutea.AAC.2
MSLLLCASAVSGYSLGPLAAQMRPTQLRLDQPRVTTDIQMGLEIDLKGKTVFVAGVADSTGYGWAICKVRMRTPHAHTDECMVEIMCIGMIVRGTCCLVNVASSLFPDLAHEGKPQDINNRSTDQHSTATCTQCPLPLPYSGACQCRCYYYRGYMATSPWDLPKVPCIGKV